MTVTYSRGQNDMVGLQIYTALTPCVTSGFPPSPEYYLVTSGNPTLGTSPVTVDQTTSVAQVSSPNPTTIPTGTYQFCLYDATGGNFVLLSSVQTTIGTVTPTTSATTTTTAAPTTTTTTTTVVDPPVTPTFAG